MLNPIFSKKVQGQKHLGRWGIVEHQIPSIKMLFKTNTKSHKHPSIRFLSKSKTQLVNQRKQKVAFSPGTEHSPIERDGVQLRQYWMTLPLYIRPITELVKGMYIHVYTYISTQSWTGTKVIRRKHIVLPTGFGVCSSAWARFLSLARSKLRLCSANHRPGYWCNLPCDWPSTAWAYFEQETENGPCCQWDGEDVPAPWDRSNSHPPIRVQKSCVNPFI